MQKNEIIDIEKIPKSAKKESSYKNFPIPEIIYKPNNKIFLLPRIKNIKKLNIDFNHNIKYSKNTNKNNDKIINNTTTKKEQLCLSESNRIKSEKSKKIIHNIIINSKNYPNLKANSLCNKPKININNLKLKSLLNKDNLINIHINDDNNPKSSRINIHLFKNWPKITLTKDKMFNRFRDGISKLRSKRLIILEKNKKRANDINNINDINNKNDIFKTTEVFPNINIGCKYDPGDKNTMEEDEKIEFNEKIRDMVNKICNSNIKSRNIRTRNCYEILDDLKKKRTYDCERLIEKTTEEVKDYKNRINCVYNNLKKTFEEGEEWNNINYFYNNY